MCGEQRGAEDCLGEQTYRLDLSSSESTLSAKF